MGIRGEVFSNRVVLPNRTYFFNVKENRMGDLYLNIVESKNRDNGGFERQSVILFAEDLQEFLKGFDESLKVLEKAARDKKKKSRKDTGKQNSFFETAQRPQSRVFKAEEKDFYSGNRSGGRDGERGSKRDGGNGREGKPGSRHGERGGKRDGGRDGKGAGRREGGRNSGHGGGHGGGREERTGVRNGERGGGRDARRDSGRGERGGRHESGRGGERNQKGNKRVIVRKKGK